MSYNLWKFLFDDDLDNFRQCLARATYSNSATKAASAAPSSPAFKLGSPGSLGTSPKTPRQKRGNPFATSSGSGTRASGLQLTRAELNKKDNLGRTLLHYAASLKSSNAVGFVSALLEVPVLDLYCQDAENGWTALHRALYFGNVDVARALMRKDVQNVTEYTSHAALANLGGLVKIKDVEGNSPFEVFGSTIAPRLLGNGPSTGLLDAGDNDSVRSVELGNDDDDRDRAYGLSARRLALNGDDVFAFGSNKNLSLGLGDEDDRQFPERIRLERPQHLLRRLYDDYLAEKQKGLLPEDLASSTILAPSSDIPAMIRFRPIVIHDVVMSKMHTAVLTDDPVSNLHVCGFGVGGRLGTGDENTRFDYVCVQGGGLARRHVSAVALGQYHTIGLCSSGEVFTWGSNKYGQLGYVLPESSAKDVPIQLVPRQLYGLVKKEQIIGVAASAIHSVIYSANAMYTFGKNEGQLGLVDADARSLSIQVIPRRVGTSILQATIKQVSAIDRATSVLMENHDVIVFTHYAWKKVVFPLEEVPDLTLMQGFTTRYSKESNSICKITGGGNTICTVSTFGQVFTVEIPKEVEQVAPNVSTTNPNKAKNAVPQPSRVWSIGKPHMSATDAAVGQDGSIILCTNSGSVWRKEKRAKIKSIHHEGFERTSVKEYKFVRVAQLAEAIAVRSNAFGAFMVVQKDIDVTRQQLGEDPPTIWTDLLPLLALREHGHVSGDAANQADPRLRFWTPRTAKVSPALIKHAMLHNANIEQDMINTAEKYNPLSESSYDMWIMSTMTEVRIPVHSFIVKARSRVLRNALTDLEQSYYFPVSDLLALEYGADGCVHLNLRGADILTMVNFVLYIYTDNLVDVWHHTSKALQMAPRYRQIRVEVMKIAAALEMRQLETAAKAMIDPGLSLRQDLEVAYRDLGFWSDADVVIDLADDAEMSAHSALLCARCPFFEGLFNGRAGGGWMISRRGVQGVAQELARIDLKHVDERTFQLVLRHIYADTGEELFDDIVTNTLDEYIDLVIEVMSVANELMLDRLAQVCQKVVGRYVSSRNVCGLLNTIAECSVGYFKDAALEYICLNLETILGQRLLDDLDDFLVEELSTVARDNQLSFMPFSRSGRGDAELLEQYPELGEAIEKERRRRVDAMRPSARHTRDDQITTPRRPITQTEDELPFSMDEDGQGLTPVLRAQHPSPSMRPALEDRRSSHLSLGTSVESLSQVAGIGVMPDPSNTPTATIYPFASPSDSGHNAFELPKAAWKTSPLPEARADFRSIMEQTTVSRVSSLTQQMTGTGPGSPRSTPKISQKERKRQQQELRKQDGTVKERDDESPQTPPSPWPKVTPVPHRSVSSPLSTIEPAPGVQPSPHPIQPSMTMRQTVSGSPSQTKASTGHSSAPVSGAIRVPSTLAPPQIQSIRHTPMPARSGSFVDAHTSMADILAQQQGEKTAIREAVAKRSLHEIQQEQEFQAWWDQESRRVQAAEEEEAARVHATATRSRQSGSGRGRGGGVRKRDSGRDRSHPSSDSHHQASSAPSKGDRSRAPAPAAATAISSTNTASPQQQPQPQPHTSSRRRGGHSHRHPPGKARVPADTRGPN